MLNNYHKKLNMVNILIAICALCCHDAVNGQYTQDPKVMHVNSTAFEEDIDNLNEIRLHRLTQMILSLTFTAFYLLSYSIYMIVWIRPVWSKLLNTVKYVVCIFWFLIFIDFVNILTVLMLVKNGHLNRYRGYDAQLAVKLLIRRLSQILFFKVMFTLKRVEVQLSPKYDTFTKCMEALNKLICVERSYLAFSSVCILNIGVVIFMFVDFQYAEHMQRVYESVVMGVAPFFWIVNTYFVCYFRSMGNNYIQHLDATLQSKECLIKSFFLFIGFLQLYSIVADDFIILFVSGYIFEDIEFILKNMPILDFAMTILSEQINPLNAIFVVFVINYFAKVS